MDIDTTGGLGGDSGGGTPEVPKDGKAALGVFDKINDFEQKGKSGLYDLQDEYDLSDDDVYELKNIGFDFSNAGEPLEDDQIAKMQDKINDLSPNAQKALKSEFMSDKDDDGSDTPESELEKLDKDIKSTEATMNMYQFDYSDSRNQDMANDLSRKLRKLRADREKLTGGSDKNETKVINGKKYKAIKESVNKKVTVKEVKSWLKGLEEFRYRKIPSVDARRITSFVNNGLSETDLPASLQKKWGNAKYSKEKGLADRFMKERINKRLTQNESNHPIKEQYNRLFKNKVVL